MLYDWSPQQDKALRVVSDWVKDQNSPQVFYLGGFAGTGKTTLAKYLAESTSFGVCFAAFTGKAAMVMRSKGCAGASTIHSLIYKAYVDKKTSEVEYYLNPDSAAATSNLIIIDECSMVDSKLGKDLLSFGTKVLVIGDPFQLPPVSSAGFFTNGDPDILLTEVHRHAKDNPVFRLSMDVREGRRLQYGQHGDSKIIKRSALADEELLLCDQVIVGANSTRMAYNHKMRALRHQPPNDMPVVGEKLICLHNNSKKGLLNGGMWKVVRTGQPGTNVNMTVESLDEVGAPRVGVNVPSGFFGANAAKFKVPPMMKYKVDEFTYGHAITCHKSQGSQWSDTVVFDESDMFREDSCRWLYTAITRASKKMTLVTSE